jgi:hypothetical protein
MRFIRNQHLRVLFNLLSGMFFMLFLARDWFVFVNAVTLLNYCLGFAPKQYRYTLIAGTSFVVLGYAHYVRWMVHNSISDRTKTRSGKSISMWCR